MGNDIRTLIRPIPDGTKHPWSAEITFDEEGVKVQMALFTSPLGNLAWGQRPEGTIGWLWRETGGGGSVTTLYTVVNQRLYLSMLYEERKTQGGLAWNVPRAFVDPNEDHFTAAQREMGEEIGYIPLETRLFLLQGEPGNWNSTFSDTSEVGKGVRFYGLEVLPHELEPEGEVFKFKAFLQPKTKLGERILACRFHPWWMAARVSDHFSGKALSRLVDTRRELIAFLK